MMLFSEVIDIKCRHCGKNQFVETRHETESLSCSFCDERFLGLKQKPSLFILDSYGFPIECKNVLKWIKWFRTHIHEYKRTKEGDQYTIVTCFTGIHYPIFGNTQFLFETRIVERGKFQSVHCIKSTNWQKALKNHAFAHKWIKGK